MGLKFINDFVVIVSGKELIKQLYNREELNGRPDGFFFRIRSFNKRLGVVFTDGALWEAQRQFSVKTMKTLGFGKLSMVKHIEFEARELIKSLESRCAAGEDIAVQNDGNNIFDISVMNVMWMILRGERYELDDQRIIQLMEAIHKSFQIVDMSGGVLNHFPFVRHFLPNWSGFKPLVETLQPLWNFLNVRRIIFFKFSSIFFRKSFQLNIMQVQNSFDAESSPKNFIEFYCREISVHQSTETFFTREQLMALCVDFFQAGSETTSNTLAFGMLHMLKHPQVMEKVQKELESVLGDRLPRLSDRDSLKYTEATIYEIQRISNVAPLGEKLKV